MGRLLRDCIDEEEEKRMRCCWKGAESLDSNNLKVSPCPYCVNRFSFLCNVLKCQYWCKSQYSSISWTKLLLLVVCVYSSQ